MQRLHLGIDVGGSFTDLIAIDHAGNVLIGKTPTPPANPERGIMQGLHDLDIDPRSTFSVIHGTTTGTNAVLEGHGVKTAYVTNRGFADTLLIGRQTREHLYDLKPAPKHTPLHSNLCFEVGGRLSASGTVLEALDPEETALLRQNLIDAGVEAVAVNLLFSFLDDRFEKALAAALSDRFFVSLSSELHPIPAEYERGVVSWLNSRIGPLIAAYLKKLRSALPSASIQIMQSHGHTIEAEQASQRSINLLLSGPAAGVMAVKKITDALGAQKVLSFDMGGTSTDISIIDGDIQLTDQTELGQWPIAVPMIDIHSIGAGGGSIVSVDEAGLLRVGPGSAGSHPGPACYGRGGQLPTVTDANLLLGHLPSHLQRIELSEEHARTAFAPLCERLDCHTDELVQGVIELANEQMTQALRKVLATQTCTPDELLLCGFGAAGGLHICALAEQLGISQAIVPAHAGILSAIGLLTASKGLHRTDSVCQRIDQLATADVDKRLKDLEDQVHSAMQQQDVDEMTMRRYAECRYDGQLFCLSLEWQGIAATAEAFHTLHKAQYGHRLDTSVELVSLRVEAHSTPAVDYDQIAACGRPTGPDTTFAGPYMVADPTATSWIAEGWVAERNPLGHLLLRRN